MTYPKYCKFCGCYIPDNYNVCPACNKDDVRDEVLEAIKNGYGLNPIEYVCTIPLPTKTEMW